MVGDDAELVAGERPIREYVDQSEWDLHGEMLAEARLGGREAAARCGKPYSYG